MATGTGNLPFPGKVYNPFDILTAEELNEDVSNIESLATGTGIGDGAVTFAKTSGIWWEEIGRTTLGSTSDTITVSSLPNRKYLTVYIHLFNSGAIDPALTFNGDTGNNYALRVSNNGGADSTSVSRANWTFMVAGGSFPVEAIVSITNISVLEKIGLIHAWEQNTAGAGNAPGRTERIGKWANTAAAISSITLINNGAGDFQAGSEVVVLGHN